MQQKFVMLFSGGKDSTLALHRCIKEKNIPIALIMMVKENEKISWFHNINLDIVKEMEKSLNIPIIQCKTTPQNYYQNMKNLLLDFKNKGVTYAVFGDIDIEEHFEWCKNICDDVGIGYYFPLWKENRRDLVMEFINNNYTAIVKCVRNSDNITNALGKVLDENMLKYFEEKNIDCCGENGEYHTIVVNGPIFSTKINVSLGDTFASERTTYIDIKLKTNV